MLSNHMNRFLRDESGGYTIWGLTWFILYVGIGGLAVDMTDAFRNQSMLQATADAAALAGIVSPLNNEAEVDAWALTYAESNMHPSVHSNVVTATDVDIGTWDFTTRTFTEGGAKLNAVRAIARRDAINANPVATNFLRIIGLQTWNVNAEGIAAIGIDECLNNGIVAGGELFVKPNIHFHNNICLIGHEKFWFIDNGTTFDTGVYVGAGCEDANKKCIGPGSQVLKNEDFQYAFNMDGGGNYVDETMPENAENLDLYISAVLDLPNYDNFNDFLYGVDGYNYNEEFIDYSGYKYLSNSDDGVTNGVGKSYGDEPLTALPVPLEPYTVYDLDCLGGGGADYTMPDGDYDHVAIIADCPLKFGTDNTYKVTSSLIASTYSGSNAAIDLTGHVDIGNPAGCDGGSELYAQYGDIHFAANGTFTGVRILAGGDVDFAASPNGPVGITVEAMGDFSIASGSAAGSEIGLCPDAKPNGARELSIALVH